MALAVFIHGMVDVNMPLRIFADTMRIPVFDVRRQFAPVVDGLISVRALAQYRGFRTRFILRPNDRRCGNGGNS